MAYIGALFFIIGKTAFMFFIPALAGYIAYAIADRPGIAPGFVMGGLAANIFGVPTAADNPVSLPATGFLGAIIGGVLAGVIAHWIAGWKVPTWARGLMPVLVIPLLDHRSSPASLMIIVLGKPIGWLMDKLNEGLTLDERQQRGPARRDPRPDDGLRHGRSAEQGRLQLRGRRRRRGRDRGHRRPELKIMAAVMLAGMVPPIALALATVVRPRPVQPARARERQGGLAARARRSSPRARSRSPRPTRCGSSRRSCSAAPSPAASPWPWTSASGHRTAGSSCSSPSHNILGYLIALVAGVLVGCAAVIALKSMGARTPSRGRDRPRAATV